MFRKIAATLAAALALFHVWLFAGQALQGELADPARLVRWLIAGALLAALVALHRAGAPLVRGRRAVTIWLLAALLHGPALGQRLEALERPAVPEAAAASLAPLAAFAAAALGVILLLSIARASRRDVRAPYRETRPAALVGAIAGGAYHAFSPRPPPSR